MARNIENKLDRIVIKLKKRNPLVEIVMKKGTKKHKNKRKEVLNRENQDWEWDV